MSEFVTGDAVVLGLRPARVPSRALAVLMDLTLAWLVYLLLTMALLTATASLDAAATAAVQVALFLLVLVGAPIAVETLSGGRSLGKLAAGLRVVREDGGPIRFRHALVRGAIGVVELQLLFGVIACVVSLMSERGRRLGDVFAGTLVVRERVPVPRGLSVPPPPPWLAGQLSEVDLSRVPDGLWLAVRQYLMRADQLDPGVGGPMAARLADDVRAWTGAPAPEGMTAAVYLAGVVAERQARDARRVFPGSAVESEQVPQGGAVAAGPGTRSDGWQARPDGSRGAAAPSGTATAGAPERGAEGDEEPPAPRTGFVPPV